MNTALFDRIAVCTWSLQPAQPEALIRDLKAIGIRRVQLALDPIRESPATWGGIPKLFTDADVTIVSGMFGTLGEDYSTMESIRRTGGVVPDAAWPANWQNIQANAILAENLGIPLVTFHAGFLPHHESDPAFTKLLDRIALIADCFAARGIDLAFETGQETAETLRDFLKKLNRPSVGVNFDPANMILYDKGDPIQALRVLGPHLKQCHIKDAVKTTVPGEWGQEVVAGTGQVDWPTFFRTLQEIHYSGNFAIEREAGSDRVRDIRAAREFIEALPLR